MLTCEQLNLEELSKEALIAHIRWLYKYIEEAEKVIDERSKMLGIRKYAEEEVK